MKIHVTCKVLYVKILVVYVLKDNNSVNYPKQVLKYRKIGLYMVYTSGLTEHHFIPIMLKL